MIDRAFDRRGYSDLGPWPACPSHCILRIRRLQLDSFQFLAPDVFRFSRPDLCQIRHRQQAALWSARLSAVSGSTETSLCGFSRVPNISSGKSIDTHSERGQYSPHHSHFFVTILTILTGDGKWCGIQCKIVNNVHAK